MNVPIQLLTLDGIPSWVYDSYLIERIESIHAAKQMCSESLFAKIKTYDQLWTFSNGDTAFGALCGRAGIVLLRGLDNPDGSVELRIVDLEVTMMN